MKIGQLMMCAAAVAFSGAAAMARPIIYTNDFSTSAGSEWSNTTISTAPSGEKFLGEFSAGTVTLDLGTQAAGIYSMTFSFYAIQSLDGNGPAGGGPDTFDFQADGVSKLLTSFDNWGNGNTQSYPGPYPSTNATGAGATSTNALGYTFGGAQYGDSEYTITISLLHLGGDLSFSFISNQNQAIGDEGWGIDNVSVSAGDRVGVVPLPAAALAGLSGLAMVGGLSTRRRRA